MLWRRSLSAGPTASATGIRAVVDMRRLAPLPLAIALLGTGCSDNSTTAASDAPTTGTTIRSTTTAHPVPGPERFTGSVDDFYVVPEPLPPGEPGERSVSWRSVR